jgi:predicted DNA binding CopG/RHH family protein
LTDDSLAFAASLRTLLSLIFTSSGFRLVISDILITTRQILADTASDVAAVAAYVETRAENIEQVIRPGEEEGGKEITVEDVAKQAEKIDETVREDLKKARTEAELKKHVIEERLSEESPDRVKQTVMERVEAVRYSPNWHTEPINMTIHYLDCPTSPK